MKTEMKQQQSLSRNAMEAVISKENGVTTITKKKGKPFRILQLTDVHLGGGLISSKKDKMALNAVKKIVKASDADFIVVTGDIAYPFWINGGTHNNIKPCRMFSALMKELGIPWTMVFGNHDSEAFAKYSKEKLGDFYASQENCLFEKGPETITGVGNYLIKLNNEDGSLNTALMFIDSNAYLSWHFFSGFDVIHDDQIEWYKDTINSLSGDGERVNSLAFFHIPPKEFKEGWEKCYTGSDEAEYFLGFVQEKDNYFGYPKTKEGNFFKEMVDFNSCRGMFMGHDHLNTLSIKYKGIRLTYGMSIDYLAYPKIKKKLTQRGGTLIDINDDGTFDISLLPLEKI